MEDIGFGLQRETSLGRTLSEVRTREEVDGEEREGEKRQKLEEEIVISTTTPKQEEGGGGGGGGGLFDNLIAKLSSPRAASKPNGIEAVEADRNDIASSDGVEVQGSADTGVENGGGVFNNIISSFFHKSDEGEDVKNNGGEQGKEESENVEGEVAKEGVSQESESRNSNGGSIISSLVSDDVVPSSDEASILIHSVVHD